MREIIFIIIIHWIADFVFQDEKWSNGKSSNWEDLLSHTFVYSTIWFVALLVLTFSIKNAMIFFVITFLAHTITDYFTSRVVKQKFESKEYGSSVPNFGAFTIIGFDQLLHYIQLILTFNYLWGI